MKFSIAAVLAACGLVQSKSLAGKKFLDKKNLLSKAIPVDKHGNRRLNDEEFEITGEYSIQFNHCLSFRTEAQDEDIMFGDDFIAYTANGQIISQASYVLFNVCKTEMCYYEGEGNLWMVDLASFMGSMYNIKAMDKENYCEACDYDYCYPEEEEAEEQQDEAEEEGEEEEAEENGDERKKRRRRRRAVENKKRRRKLANNQYVEYVDCNTCDAYKCFEDEQQDEGNQYNQAQANYNGYYVDEEEAAQWIEGMIECQEIEEKYFDQNGEYGLYGGFMCNEDGSGVEPAVFLDQDCSIYTTLYSYSGIVEGSYDYQYLSYSADAVTLPFLSDVNCLQVEYASPEDAEEEEEEEDNGEWEAPEANEHCQQVMQEAVDVDTCANYEDDGNNDNNQNQNGDENYYDWYSYTLTAEVAEDAQEVCLVVQGYEDEGQYEHTYQTKGEDGTGSGQFFDYKSSSKSGEGGFNAGKVFGIVIAIVVLVIAGVMVMQSCGGKRDSKKVPLVNKNGAGAMA